MFRCFGFPVLGVNGTCIRKAVEVAGGHVQGVVVLQGLERLIPQRSMGPPSSSRYEPLSILTLFRDPQQ